MRVLETRAASFISFKAKLQQLIQELFSPGEGIALAVLGELANEERDNNVNDNSIAIDVEDDPQFKARRKSFGDGLSERTLKARFADLDDQVISGTITTFYNFLTCV